MRVLFYGGCHAAAFRKIFERYALNLERVDHLTNFRLIRDGRPFPYDDIKALKYDWIIFNPILNKAEYNTSNIIDFCRANGIRFLSYPWLQWEGYFPAMQKTPPAWYSGWWNAGLDELASRSSSFEEFSESVLHGDALAAEALRYLDVTSSFMERLEANADLKVLPFILDRFREERLFLTPDHATTRLYQHLTREIAAAIDCPIDESFYYTGLQIQAGIKLPILPSVGRALGLKFAEGDFENNLMLGSSTLSLMSYLKLHFYREDIRVATARSGTRLRRDDNSAVAAAGKDRLLIRRLQTRAVSGYGRHEVLAVIRGANRLQESFRRPQAINFYPSHWTFSVSAKPLPDQDEKAALVA